jgi:outer membrane protein TolC
MKTLKVFLLFLLIAAPGGAFARNLTVDGMVSLALAESQDIKKAGANVKKMQAVLDGINSKRLFQMDATMNYAYSPDISRFSPWPGNNITGLLQGGGIVSPVARIPHIGTVGLSASQPIYTFGKIGYAIDVAKSAIKIAETSRKLAEVEMRAAAVQLYWSAKMTDELVDIADKSLKNTRNAQRQLTATGRANRSNLVKISADVAAREIDLADARFNRDSAHRMLKVYAGIDEDEDVVLVSAFPEKFASVKAKEINPLEWDIYEAQAKLYDSERMQKYMNWLPTIAAFGKYDYQTFSMNLPSELTDNYRHTASFGVSIQIPLADWGAARHAATESAMSAVSAREDLDKSRKLKSAEYADLIQKYNHLNGQLGDLLKARDLADKAYNLSRDRFLAGQTSATELSDVERAAAQMDMAVLNTKFQILTAAENIRKYEE